jgi:hypothetical protein
MKKAQGSADTGKWAQADTDLTSAETALGEFKGTSVADSKDFQDLDTKAQGLRKKVGPQVEKLAKAAAGAAEEKELKANSVVVTNSQLFSDYQSNEVSADNKYKGKKLLVTGTVASIEVAQEYRRRHSWPVGEVRWLRRGDCVPTRPPPSTFGHGR